MTQITIALQVTGGGLILLGFWVLLDTAKSHILHLLLAEDRARLVILVLSYLLLLLGCSMVGLVFLGCYALQSRPNLILLVNTGDRNVRVGLNKHLTPLFSLLLPRELYGKVRALQNELSLKTMPTQR